MKRVLKLTLAICVALSLTQSGDQPVHGQTSADSSVGSVGANSNRMTLNELLGKPALDSQLNDARRLPKSDSTRKASYDPNVQPAGFVTDERTVTNHQFKPLGHYKSAPKSGPKSALIGNAIVTPAAPVRDSRTQWNSPIQPAYEPAMQTQPASPRTTSQQHVQHVSFPAPTTGTPNRATKLPTYVLRNTNYVQFEERLLQTWGENLKGTPLNADQSILRLTMPGTTQSPTNSMIIDRHAGQLTFEGNPEVTQAWLHTMVDLDESPTAPVVTRLFETRLLRGQTVKQIVYLAAVQDEEIERRIPLPTTGNLDNFQDVLQEALSERVEVRYIAELGLLSIKGTPEDVAKIEAAIERFTRTSDQTPNIIKTITLENGQPATIVPIIEQLYLDRFESSEGAISITPVEGTQQIMVIGRDGAIKKVEQLAETLDAGGVQQEETGSDQFISRKLENISAADAAARINEYYRLISNTGVAIPDPPPNVLTITDPRSNTVVVRAGPSFRQEIEQLLDALDVDEAKAKSLIRTFPIRNTLSADIGEVLQDILIGGFTTSQAERGLLQGGQGQNQGAQNVTPGPGVSTPGIRSLDVDTEAGRVNAGILFGVRITSDVNSNSITVAAPERAMPLIEELIRRLDRLPNVETQLKVFEVLHGDANDLLITLQDIFGANNAAGAGGAQQGPADGLPLQSALAGDGTSLVGLRFAIDERTNSIIATGPAGELDSVFALLTRLDVPNSNQPQRQTNVYRLSNVFVDDILAPLEDWLQDRQDAIDNQFVSNTGNRNQTLQAVSVSAEPSSNSLIVEALPSVMPAVEHVIKALDRRPPMVEVKALLAEVDLNYMEQFGIEFGLQDSAIFNAGLGNIGAGFIGLDNVAGQVRSDLGVGNNNGFVFSAGNESVNLLLRALRTKNCVRVLSKPHIMTIENLEGTVQVGDLIPRIAGTTNTGIGGVTQNIVDTEVGVGLSITPRVSPDGMITMRLEVFNRTLSDSTVSIGTDAQGAQIFQNEITDSSATGTIMARSGQTVVFSGLLQEDKSESDSGLPILSDLPVIGPLFNFKSNDASRSELMIILTPRIIKGAADLEAHNESELRRMHWCQCDVNELYGDPNGAYSGQYREESPKVYFPDTDPMGNNPVLNDPAEQFQSFDQSNFQDNSQGNFQNVPAQSPRSPMPRQPFNEFGSQLQRSPSDGQAPPAPNQGSSLQNRIPQSQPTFPSEPPPFNQPSGRSPFSPLEDANTLPPQSSYGRPSFNRQASYQQQRPQNYERQPQREQYPQQQRPILQRPVDPRQIDWQREADSRTARADQMMREMKRNY